MASHAARARPNREIKDLKKRIGEVVEAVLDGTQDRGRAALCEITRRWDEFVDAEERED